MMKEESHPAEEPVRWELLWPPWKTQPNVGVPVFLIIIFLPYLLHNFNSSYASK